MKITELPRRGNAAPQVGPVPTGNSVRPATPGLAAGGGADLAGDAASQVVLATYPHGFSVRVALLLPKPDAVHHLNRCGWSEVGSTGWVRTKQRQHLRGTAWLTQRRPRNRKLPLTKANELWKTALYGLAIEEGADRYFVDLAGVRTDDIDTFFQKILEVGPADYQVAYYRAAERYFVLAPIEAMRLAAELGYTPTRGRGRLTRKDYLIQDHSMPMTVGKWAKATAALQVYRVRNGATFAYKVEVRLRGKKRDRHIFSEPDIARLDALLTDLIVAHHLHPIAKPDRWEPQGYGVRANVPFDAVLRRLPAMATRGTKLDAAVVRNCHTLAAPKVRECPMSAAAYPASSRISISRPSLSPSLLLSSSSSTTSCSPASMVTTPWAELAKEIGSSRGVLSEVILDADQDPGPFIQALVDAGDAVAITVIGDGLPTWRSVEELACELRDGGDTANTHVVVVDPSIVGALGAAASSWDPVTSAFLASDDGVLVDGDGVIIDYEAVPFDLLYLSDLSAGSAGGLRRESFSVGATFWNLMADLRRTCETTGVNVIVVSVDTRPDHGLTGQPILKTHYFRDGRVRSLLGDAGRYHSHVRYLVEQRDSDAVERIVTVKDEAEGRTGRVVYQHAWMRSGTAQGFGSGRWRWRANGPQHIKDSTLFDGHPVIEPKRGITGGLHPVSAADAAADASPANDLPAELLDESRQSSQSGAEEDAEHGAAVLKPPKRSPFSSR